MKQIHALVVRWGSTVNPWVLACIAIGLNLYWVVTLQAFNNQFLQVAGYPLLDLQNDLAPEKIITLAKFLAQISTYTVETKTLYWVFFALDTIFPPLTFSSITLLWVYLLKSNPSRLSDWLLRSYFLLIPLGVGVFGWFENLGYVAAIHTYPSPSTMPAIYLGLVFKWIKAACVIPTFPVLLLLTLIHIVGVIRRRIGREQAQISHTNTGQELF